MGPPTLSCIGPLSRLSNPGITIWLQTHGLYDSSRHAGDTEINVDVLLCVKTPLALGSLISRSFGSDSRSGSGVRFMRRLMMRGQRGNWSMQQE